MPLFQVTVVEHSSNSAVQGPPFTYSSEFNDRMLLMGMVRTVLTPGSNKQARRYIAATSKLSLRFLLDPAAAPHLRLNPAISSVLRDFSLTSRIGEVGQGVSYAHWHWSAGFSCISDFRNWSGMTAGGPDFVMYRPSTGDTYLMEAKATSTGRQLKQLDDALRQCRAVVDSCFNNGHWGSVLSITASGPAALHVRDPKTEGLIPLADRYRAFRQSYASWFDFAGESKFADYLRTLRNGPMRFEPRGFSNLRVVRSESGESDLTRHVVAQLGFDPHTTTLSVDEDVWRAIVDPSAFEAIDWSRIAARAADDGASIAFPDGTRIHDSRRAANRRVTQD